MPPNNVYSLSGLLGLSSEEEKRFLLEAGLVKPHRTVAGAMSIVANEFERFIASCHDKDVRITHTHTKPAQLNKKLHYFVIVGEGNGPVADQFKKDAKSQPRFTSQQ